MLFLRGERNRLWNARELFYSSHSPVANEFRIPPDIILFFCLRSDLCNFCLELGQSDCWLRFPIHIIWQTEYERLYRLNQSKLCNNEGWCYFSGISIKFSRAESRKVAVLVKGGGLEALGNW